MKKESWFKRAFRHTKYALNRVFTWGKRAFTGRKTQGLESLDKGEERAETPRALLVRAFFESKTAVGALVLLVCLFAFVFIAPLFVKMDINYTDALQQNAPPVYTLRKVPKNLKNGVAQIDGFSGFTVGLSLTGEPFVWGNAKDKLLKLNYNI